jgi:guanylate kinase
MSSKPARGILFIVSAPAGTGKSTLVELLTNEFSNVKRSISCTTRQPRSGEVNGRDYHFLSESAFLERVKRGDFIEHVTLFGNRYGTLKEDVEKLLADGVHVVLVIDTQGALLLKGNSDAVFIFIAPPNREELVKRLTLRGTDSKESIEQRLAEAEREMSCSAQYDYIIVNDDIHSAYQILRGIVIAEEHKKEENSNDRKRI